MATERIKIQRPNLTIDLGRKRSAIRKVQLPSKQQKASSRSELSSKPKQTAATKTALTTKKKTEPAKVTETFKQKVLLSSKATHQSIDLKS